MMQSKKNFKKGQIGVFIVIGAILLILLIFMITSSNDQKLTDMKNADGGLGSNPGDIFPLKETIDSCLESNLKKAIVISGLRGGFIYNGGEQYISSNGVKKYDNRFLLNQNLDITYLSNTLLHSRYDIFMPKFNDSLKIIFGTKVETIYTHSVEDDFKRFILTELGPCLDFEKIVGENNNLTADNFFGEILGYDSDRRFLKTTKFDAKLNDIITFEVDGTAYYGRVQTISEDSMISIISSNDFVSLTSQSQIQNKVVINLNSSVELDINFEDKSVSAILIYPMVLTRGDKKTYFKETEVFAHIRYKKMFELGKYLLSQKQFDRTLNYGIAEDLKRALENNVYYRSIDQSEIGFYLTTIMDDEAYKLKSLSIIDKGSKISSNPFVFNIGYENSAPKLNINTGSSSIDIDDFNIEYLLGVGDVIDLPLKTYISDRQVFDNIYGYFIPVDERDNQAIFEVDMDGNLHFEGLEKGINRYEVEVTDGETTNRYFFKFTVGIIN